MGKKFSVLILFILSFLIININSYAIFSEKLNSPDEGNIVKKKKDSIPIYPDLVYEYKIAELNNLSPIE